MVARTESFTIVITVKVAERMRTAYMLSVVMTSYLARQFKYIHFERRRLNMLHLNKDVYVCTSLLSFHR